MSLGLNSQNSKLLNKSNILKIVTMHGPVSRLDLHDQTRLSKMTISNLVTEYLEEGVMRIVEEGGNRPGRKTELLEVVPSALLTCGIYISSSHIRVGIIDLKGAILQNETVRLSPDEGQDSFIRKLLLLLEMVMTGEYQDRIWGIGVSSLGPLDVKNGRILHLSHFPHIPYIDITAALQSVYPFPVYVENDVNVSALAELYFGNGRYYDDFVYVSVKSGIGSGVVAGQKLFSGHHGFAGELGHISVCSDGLSCSCGSRGCLELYASIPATLSWYAEQTGTQISDWLSLIDRYKQGDPVAVKAFDRMCGYLASGLTSIANIIDPQCIFLGGEIGPAIPILIPRLQEALTRYRFSPLGTLKIQSSRHPGSSGFIGTAALVMECNAKNRGPSPDD